MIAGGIVRLPSGRRLHEGTRLTDIPCVRPFAVAVTAFAGAALLRDAGVVVVYPLLIAGGYAAALCALDFAAVSATPVRIAVLTACMFRAVLALGLYCASYYHWPIGRSLQVGNGFWSFCMDALNYHAWAPQILTALEWHLPIPDPHATIDYYLIVAMVYGLFGTSPLTAIAISVGAWTVATALLIGLVQWLRRAAIPPAVGIVVAWWPSGLIWPTQVMKDSIVVLLLVVSVAVAARLIASRRPIEFACWTGVLWVTLMPLLRLRVYTAWLLLAAALIAAVVGTVRAFTGDRGWQPIVGSALVALLAYVGPGIIGATDPLAILAPRDPAESLVNYGRELERRHDPTGARAAYEEARVYQPASPTILSALNRLPTAAASRGGQHRTGASSLWLIAVVGRGMWGSMADQFSRAAVPAPSDTFSALAPGQLGATREKFAATGGSSAVAPNAKIGGWVDVIRLGPAIGATALFAPFPWDVFRPRGITGAFRTFAVIEPLLMLPLFPALILSVRRLHEPSAWFVAAVAASGAFAAAYAIPNIGTLVRLRAGFTLILVAIAAFGWRDYATLVRAIGRRFSAANGSREKTT